MKIVFREISQNGFRGLEIVSGTAEAPARGSFVARGSLRPLGTTAGVRSFEFTASDEADTWVLATRQDVEPIEGATLATRVDLCGDRYASVIVMGPLAIVREWGYKRRSSRFVMYRGGEEQEVPPSVLLALGLIEPESAPEAIAPPPAPSGAFAEALAAALGRRAD